MCMQSSQLKWSTTQNKDLVFTVQKSFLASQCIISKEKIPKPFFCISFSFWLDLVFFVVEE